VADALGGPIRADALHRAFRTFVSEHGFGDVSFRALRDSNAVAMQTAGVDVRTAARRLGHSTPELLFKTYSHFVRSADQAAAERLAGIFRG
jgi:integrase